MKTLRLIVAGWIFHVKTLTMSGFFLLTSAVQPVIFATMAFLMFRAGTREGTLLYVSLGSGLMGIWSSTLFGSGGAIQWQRWQGTLEVVIAAPTPLVLALIPMTLATATIGLYSMCATLLWGKVFFHVPFHPAHPALFALSIPATILGLGMLGLVLASTFVLYRNANAMSNLLEYPVWLVTGLLTSISLLPGWTHPISWVLAPTWGVRAVRESAIGGHPLRAIGMCVALAAVYFVIGTYFIRYFERLARERATLSLV